MRADLQKPYAGVLGLLKDLYFSFSIYRESKVTHSATPCSISAFSKLPGSRISDKSIHFLNLRPRLHTQTAGSPDTLITATKPELFAAQKALQEQQVLLYRSSAPTSPSVGTTAGRSSQGGNQSLTYPHLQHVAGVSELTEQLHFVSPCQACV